MAELEPNLTSRGRELLRCEGLRIGYRRRPLLPPIDLSIRAGDIVLVVGRNGAGKSTWLRTVLGLLPPVAGRVVVPEPAPRMGYVPQAASLDPMLPLRAQTVVGWGRLRRWSFLSPLASKADREACRAAVEQARAGAFRGQPFRDLSGGQKQRVLLARLLAGDAELALLDEPTASLDVASERMTCDRLASLARDQGVGVVIVTHTLGLAREYADRVLFLDTGERRSDGVVEYGTAEEVFAHPRFRSHFDAHIEAVPGDLDG